MQVYASRHGYHSLTHLSACEDDINCWFCLSVFVELGIRPRPCACEASSLLLSCILAQDVSVTYVGRKGKIQFIRIFLICRLGI